MRAVLKLALLQAPAEAAGLATEMSVPLAGARFVIGRDPASDWSLPDATLAVSARHCEVVADAAGAWLRDLSTNGTFVNGSEDRLTTGHRLQPGDRIALGPYTLAVLAAPAGLPGAALEGPAPAPLASSPPPAAVRGGDPAAMLRAGRSARVGLTEILRAAPPAEDSPVEMTRIRRAASRGPAVAEPTAAGERRASRSGTASAVSASPLTAADPSTTLLHLAAGLGLPAGAFDGRDAEGTSRQVAALAAAALAVLQALNAGPRLASASSGTPLPPVPTDDLLALLAPGTDVQAALLHAAQLAAARRHLGKA